MGCKCQTQTLDKFKTQNCFPRNAHFFLKLAYFQAMQEFMILPVGAANFTEAMKMGSETYHHLKNSIKAKYGLDATAVGDEGGFAPNFQNNEDAINLCVEAIG